MNAKEYLFQAFRLDQRINSKLEQVSKLRSIAMKASGLRMAERISGTKENSLMETALVKMIDLENEINDDIDRLVDLKRELVGLIEGVADPSHRLLLEMRYLGGNTWEDIAGKMGYDLRWVYRLHGKALQEFELLRSKSVKVMGVSTR